MMNKLLLNIHKIPIFLPSAAKPQYLLYWVNILLMVSYENVWLQANQEAALKVSPTDLSNYIDFQAIKAHYKQYSGMLRGAKTMIYIVFNTFNPPIPQHGAACMSINSDFNIGPH